MASPTDPPSGPTPAAPVTAAPVVTPTTDTDEDIKYLKILNDINISLGARLKTATALGETERQFGRELKDLAATRYEQAQAYITELTKTRNELSQLLEVQQSIADAGGKAALQNKLNAELI